MATRLEQGPFLAMLIQLMGAKKCLEVGTFTGYSAAWVASVLPADGKLVCCELSDCLRGHRPEAPHGNGSDEEGGVPHRPGGDSLSQLLAAGEAGTFDYAFIDADKGCYDLYYEQCLELVRARRPPRDRQHPLGRQAGRPRRSTTPTRSPSAR